MDRTALRNLARYWLDDLQGGYFTDTQMNVFLNNAARQVQKILIQSFEGRYEIPKQTTTVAQQAFYALPSDFLKVNRLIYVCSGSSEVNEEVSPLQFVTQNEADGFDKLGTPYAYTIIGDKLKLFPAPDSAKTLRMYYTYRITDMSQDSDTPDVPEEYHEFIAILAAKDGLIKDGRDIKEMLEKEKTYLASIKQDAENRNVDGPRHIVRTQGGW